MVLPSLAAARRCLAPAWIVFANVNIYTERLNPGRKSCNRVPWKCVMLTDICSDPDPDICLVVFAHVQGAAWQRSHQAYMEGQLRGQGLLSL
jgi:hypothetical protein